MTTLRPLGPRVTLTALASALTPDRMRLRATSVYTISLADMWMGPFRVVLSVWSGRLELLLDHAQDVVFSQDETVFAVDLDFGAGVLSEENGVTGLHVELPHRPVLEHLPVADGDNLPLYRLFPGGVWNDDPAFGHFFFFNPTDDDATLQRPKAHGANSCCVVLEKRQSPRDDSPSRRLTIISFADGLALEMDEC